MSRNPKFSLAYTHDVFGRLTGQAFKAPSGIPDNMRALLNKLDAADTRAEWTLADRLEALKSLTDAEAPSNRASRG